METHFQESDPLNGPLPNDSVKLHFSFFKNFQKKSKNAFRRDLLVVFERDAVNWPLAARPPNRNRRRRRL